MSICVVNTSPLVFLGNLGRLELLRHEGREVSIPQAVAEEIAEKPDAAARAVQSACATWMQSLNVTTDAGRSAVEPAIIGPDKIGEPGETAHGIIYVEL